MPYDVETLKVIISKHIANIEYALKEVVPEIMGRGSLQTGSWSNERGLAAAYISYYPTQDTAQESIDAVMSLTPVDDQIQFTADISWSDGVPVVDIDRQYLEIHDGEQIADDLHRGCQRVSALMVAGMREILVNLKVAHRNG